MPTYVFKGRNRLNEIVVGERVADNREALRQILRREQVTLTSVKEKGREIGIPKIGGRKKVKSKDLSVFTRQFSVMIDAGLPLVQCLEILAQQQDNKYFQQILLQVRQDVEEGSTLAAAMARHPRVFDQLYANMVEAGETGGILDLILQRLSTFIEKIVKLKRDIISAMIYPAAVILLAIVAVAVIMIVVIPQFQQIFLCLVQVKHCRCPRASWSDSATFSRAGVVCRYSPGSSLWRSRFASTTKHRAAEKSLIACC
jgi:type IV pilus assembly protein PilC